MTSLSDAMTALPGAAVTAVSWRARRQLQVTVIAKATFAFAPDGDMPCVDPQPILREEAHHNKNPTRSIRLTTDLAPYLARADVVFTGHAHAPPGAPTRELAVRVAVFDRERARMDKTLVVRDPAGFQRLPMMYERTFGGIGFADNPFGVGFNLDSEAPNIFDPAQPQRPACFAPLGRAFPPRKRLLGTTARALLDGKIAEIPDDFDWSYYQAAPPDQRAEHLKGGEWVVLEGLHPTHPGLRTRLPDARGFARVHGLARFGVADGQILELIADTLRIDGDEQRCTVVWRRSFPVYAEEALAALRIVAGVEVAGAALRWPEVSAPEAERRSPHVLSPPLPDKGAHDSTMIWTDELEEVEPESSHPLAGTMVVDSDPPVTATPTTVLPFIKGEASALAQPSPRRNPPRESPFSETLAEHFDEAPAAQRSVLPFAQKPASAPQPAAVIAPLPVAAAPAPAPAPAAAAPAPPPAAAAPAPASPPVEPVRPTASEVQWAPPPPPLPPSKPVQAAPAMPTASPRLKKGLYGRFGR